MTSFTRGYTPCGVAHPAALSGAGVGNHSHTAASASSYSLRDTSGGEDQSCSMGLLLSVVQCVQRQFCLPWLFREGYGYGRRPNSTEEKCPFMAQAEASSPLQSFTDICTARVHVT